MTQRRALPLLLFLLLSLPVAAALGQSPPRPPAPLRALLVGGGPDPSYNQVGIESNVRYVHRLLPPNAISRVLFADGNLHSVNVLYEDASGNDHYRLPHLPALTGPSRLAFFDQELRTVAAIPGGPLLLYFTGHGGPGETGYDDNEYGMWDGDSLTVRQLAGQIDRLPTKTPVVLVMVQCFSGGFGNVLFQGGDPHGQVIGQDLCGFFASIPSREAAGCTPDVNEADYHDFTGYFFAALSGRDRLGRPVTGADYNHDGHVGMDEAYAYALIHDVSIDTPTCTSDVYLRRFVPTPDPVVFATSYSDALRWATPAQHAALTALSQTLRLTGPNRLRAAYAALQQIPDSEDDDDPHDADIIRFVRVAKSVILAHTLLQSGAAPLKARYDALIVAEARNPLMAR